MCLDELNMRFDNESYKILRLVTGIGPADNFSSFDTEKIMQLLNVFEKDFPEPNILHLELNDFLQMKNDASNKDFLSSFEDLQKMYGMVDSKLSETFPNIFRLICIVLTLLISSATTERAKNY